MSEAHDDNPASIGDGLDKWNAVPWQIKMVSSLISVVVALACSHFVRKNYPPTMIVAMRATIVEGGHFFRVDDKPVMLRWAVHFSYAGENVYKESDRFEVRRTVAGKCYWVRATRLTEDGEITARQILSEAPSEACLR